MVFDFKTDVVPELKNAKDGFPDQQEGDMSLFVQEYFGVTILFIVLHRFWRFVFDNGLIPPLKQKYANQKTR